MDKTYRDEFRRLFLIEHLPEPMTRADPHLQIFDNYVENTRLRIRSVRVPETKQWSWIMQQRLATGETGAHRKIAEIHLDETEYHLFEQFEGREIRKNRYFYANGDKQIEFDVYLGDLWGLNIARVRFDSFAEAIAFQFPFSAIEVTDNVFFDGTNLVDKSFADVQDEVAEILAKTQSRDTAARGLAKEHE